MSEHQQLRATALRLVAGYDPGLDGSAAFAELEVTLQELLELWRPRP